MKDTQSRLTCNDLLDCAVPTNSLGVFRFKPSLLDTLEKRYHFVRVERLLSAPEDVVNVQILRRKFDHFGDGHTLSCVGVHIFIITILHRDAARHNSG